MNAVTIKNVAALAGVSIKTVSRVLNREPNVRSETRDKVLGAVKALNFTPNFAARALAGSRAYLLGLYYDSQSLGYTSAIQVGAMNGCRAAGYHLLVERVEGEGPAARERVETLLSAVKVDGLVLSPSVCERPGVLDALDERRVPYVRVGPATQFDRGSYVYMDDEQAAYEMTVHLQGLGHRRIGFVKGHADHATTPLRHRGFERAMRDAGLEIRPEWVQSGNFSFRSGIGAAERMLNLAERPTAIFATNDDMALGVMTVASRMGLRLPRDLSVAGFDDSPIAQVVWPQLTTIRQPVERMASEAVAMLIDELGRNKTPQARLLEFDLIVRGSTGPAPDPSVAGEQGVT